MIFKGDSKLKRISIDLPESLISRFDDLRREWGLKARGPVIERLLKEVLEEEEYQPNNIQQTLNFNSDYDINQNIDYDEFSSLVLIDYQKGGANQEKAAIDKLSTNKSFNEKKQVNIDLPNFVNNKVNKLKRSLNSENLKNKINEYVIDPINDDELKKCQFEIRNHWNKLYGTTPNEIILEASMEWFSRDIWPYLDGAEQLSFTWTAANRLMREVCPTWIKEPASFELVILMVGILEDPFAASNLINRIPTLVRRFVSKFKRVNKSNSFKALDSTMTVVGALKLLNLSTQAGASHTLSRIRNSYKMKALEYHPDKGGSTDNMRQLNEAYQLLKSLYRK